MVRNFECFPRAALIPELAGELKFLPSVVDDTAIMPSWRGERLQAFMRACGSCTKGARAPLLRGGGARAGGMSQRRASCQPCSTRVALTASALAFPPH